MIENVLDLIEPLFTSRFGYLVIGIAVMVDRGAFVGLVAPGDLFLALGGIYAGQGELSVSGVIAAGIVGALIGENVSYWLGRRYGVTILRHIPLANRFEKYLGRSDDFFERHGSSAVFIGRYMAVVGTFLPFTAGMSRMRYGRFVFFDTMAVAVWALGVVLLGYLLSAQLELVDRILSRLGWGLLILVLVLVGARLTWDRRDRIGRWFRSAAGRNGDR